jgi:hypothetical protein
MYEIFFFAASVRRNPTTNKAVDGDISKIVQCWLKYAGGRRTKGDEEEKNAAADENVEEPNDAE